MPPPAVTLTIYLLTPESNQHIYNSDTPVTKNGWNFFHWQLCAQSLPGKGFRGLCRYSKTSTNAEQVEVFLCRRVVKNC